MGDKINGEYFEAGAAAFNYNNVTGGADSASGGSGGSGMECLQLRSPPGPFHYLISEQAKSLVALQELQNEVGALLEFRDLVIETFPNLRSKMAPSTPASGTRRDWEPGVRVRRKLAGSAGDAARAKPQPSVQDSGFSTETSCGKDAHSSASTSTTNTTSTSAAGGAGRPRPLEDELWALLDVIHRKGGRVRDEAELLRTELDHRGPEPAAEELFARALAGECANCTDVARLRGERDQLLVRAAQLEATPPAAAAPRTPLGRLDQALDTPSRLPQVAVLDSNKFAAILLESNPAELQRQLLTSTVQKQVLCDSLRRAAAQRTVILERLERARDLNEDLKFRLEEKSIELEGARARVRQLEGKPRAVSLERHSMRDMQPLHIPDAHSQAHSPDDEPIADTPRRRPSRIPLHKGAAPRPPTHVSQVSQVSRPPSAHSAHSVRSARSASSRRGASAVPVRRDSAAPDAKRADSSEWGSWLCAEYVERAGRLAPLLPPLAPELPPLPRLRPLPHNLHHELERSVLYDASDSLRSAAPDELWANRPQQYFESMNYGAPAPSDTDDYDTDSLAP